MERKTIFISVIVIIVIALILVIVFSLIKGSATGNTMNIKTTCTPGQKCYTAYVAGYQNSDCTWTHTQNCPFGCSNGVCMQ